VVVVDQVELVVGELGELELAGVPAGWFSTRWSWSWASCASWSWPVCRPGGF
jgi:hypothetical protein